MVRDPSAMEPILPGRDGDLGDLADLALALVAESAQAAGRLHPITEATLRDLLRTRPGPAHRRRGEPSSARVDTSLSRRKRARHPDLHRRLPGRHRHQMVVRSVGPTKEAQQCAGFARCRVGLRSSAQPTVLRYASSAARRRLIGHGDRVHLKSFSQGFPRSQDRQTPVRLKSNKYSHRESAHVSARIG